MKYEISVRPVTRYVVIEYHEDEAEKLAGSQGCGEYSNPEIADEMAQARASWRREKGDEVAEVRLSDHVWVTTTASTPLDPNLTST